MLTAYIDDSGTHNGSHNAVMAGYWAGVNQWKRFEQVWNSVLRSESVPYFHAKDFWFRKEDGE